MSRCLTVVQQNKSSGQRLATSSLLALLGKNGCSALAALEQQVDEPRTNRTPNDTTGVPEAMRAVKLQILQPQPRAHEGRQPLLRPPKRAGFEAKEISCTCRVHLGQLYQPASREIDKTPMAADANRFVRKAPVQISRDKTVAPSDQLLYSNSPSPKGPIVPAVAVPHKVRLSGHGHHRDTET